MQRLSAVPNLEPHNYEFGEAPNLNKRIISVCARSVAVPARAPHAGGAGRGRRVGADDGNAGRAA